MAPPYVVIDKGDGNKPVTGDIPAAAGDKFEVFKNGTARVAGPFGPATTTTPPPTDPPPTDPPTTIPDPGRPVSLEDAKSQAWAGIGNQTIIQAGNLPAPTSAAGLKSLMQAVVDRGGGGLVLDPNTAVNIDQQILVDVKDTGDDGVYFNFNGARLSSSLKDGTTDAVVLRTSGAGVKRHLQVHNFTLYGGGYDSAGCRDGLVLIAEGGAMFHATFWNCRSSWAGRNGYRFQGDFFESDMHAVHAKDCKGSGAFFTHNPGVISNVMMYGGGMSRCLRYGIETEKGVQSLDIFGGSLVNNSLGGISGAFRSAIAINGENTGQHMFDTGFLPYPCRIVACNLSTNGRQTSGPGALPSQYFVRTQSRDKLEVVASYITPYNEQGGAYNGVPTAMYAP